MTMDKTDIAPIYNGHSRQMPVPHAGPASLMAGSKLTDESVTLSSGIIPETYDAWLPYLDHVDGTLEQKKELIQALWQIIIAHVDLQWSTAPAPDGQSGACGQMPELSQIIHHIMVDYEDSPTVSNETGGGTNTRPNDKPITKTNKENA